MFCHCLNITSNPFFVTLTPSPRGLSLTYYSFIVYYNIFAPYCPIFPSLRLRGTHYSIMRHVKGSYSPIQSMLMQLVMIVDMSRRRNYKRKTCRLASFFSCLCLRRLVAGVLWILVVKYPIFTNIHLKVEIRTNRNKYEFFSGVSWTHDCR